MTPQDLVNRIIELGLNGADADTDMATKVLAWLNMSYAEIYGLTVKWGYPLRTSNQTVTATAAGLATLDTSLRNIKSVYDVTNGKMLKASDVDTVECRDPSLALTGTPCDYYVDNIDPSTQITDIRVHPNSAVDLRVRGVEAFNTLALDDDEYDIQLPPEFHEVLIWATLILGTTYERGFGNDSLISFANARKSQLQENMQMYFAANVPHAPRRVQYQDL